MPILVVDDEPVFRSAISAILRKSGFQTIEAQDGLEAYEIIQAIGADVALLLTDLQMPGMDGTALIESVRELYPRLPVLLMTGSRLENRLVSYTVLSKPISRDVLLQAVRSVIPAPQPREPVRKIEIFFNRGCGSETLVTAIRAAACPCCEVTALNMEAAEVAERARRLGVQSIPAVAINGVLVCNPCECGPDLVRLRAAGLGVPLSRV